MFEMGGFEGRSPVCGTSRGREYLDFCERSETKSLVTRDRILYINPTEV